jgi:hypothetical protein
MENRKNGPNSGYLRHNLDEMENSDIREQEKL